MTFKKKKKNLEIIHIEKVQHIYNYKVEVSAFLGCPRHLGGREVLRHV